MKNELQVMHSKPITEYLDREDLSVKLQEIKLAGLNANTERAYQGDLRAYMEFCHHLDLAPYPLSASDLDLFLVWAGEKKWKMSTIRRRLHSVRMLHKQNKQPFPIDDLEIKLTIKGIRSDKERHTTGKQPITSDLLTKMIGAVPDTAIGRRDRAIMALCFNGAFRRSEVMGLDVGDLQPHELGLKVHLVRSKTDKTQSGVDVIVERWDAPDFCPVALLKNYIERARIVEGPIFRSFDPKGNLTDKRLNERHVALLTKNYAYKIGLNPEIYSGHSYRAGFATTMDRVGGTLNEIMEGGRWKSPEVAMRYIRTSREKMRFSPKLQSLR